MQNTVENKLTVVFLKLQILRDELAQVTERQQSILGWHDGNADESAPEKI